MSGSIRHHKGTQKKSHSVFKKFHLGNWQSTQMKRTEGQISILSWREGREGLIEVDT